MAQMVFGNWSTVMGPTIRASHISHPTDRGMTACGRKISRTMDCHKAHKPETRKAIFDRVVTCKACLAKRDNG